MSSPVTAPFRPPSVIVRTAAHQLTEAGHHAITFTGGRGWELRHPAFCGESGSNGCPVWPAAVRTLLLSEYQHGTFRCEASPRGYLSIRGGRHL